MSFVENNGRSTGGCTGKGYFPGQSGNPGGRPKAAHNFAQEIHDYLNRKDGDATNLEVILKNLMERRPEILLYYAFGKPIETQLQLSSQEEMDIQVAVTLAGMMARGEIMRGPLNKEGTK